MGMVLFRTQLIGPSILTINDAPFNDSQTNNQSKNKESENKSASFT